MPRPTGIFKKENDYQKLISPQLYESIPKAVFAAIAVSYLLNMKGVSIEEIDTELNSEWEVLNSNGIVPQKPKK